MKPLSAECSREFFPAYHHSGVRPTSEIYWIVMHDEEASSARGSARYFQDPASTGSTQLTVDAKECYRCLFDDVIPWAASSAPQLSANSHGFHIEQAGFAIWSTSDWKAHIGTLKRAAYKAAQHCHKFDFGPVWVGRAALIAYGRGHTPVPKGITTHREISAASLVLDPRNAHLYTHSDPGPFWPRMLFMALARRYYKQMK